MAVQLCNQKKAAVKSAGLDDNVVEMESLMKSSDLRAVGRNALRGRWGTAILVTLVACLLGGSMGVGNNLESSSSTSATTNGYSNYNDMGSSAGSGSWLDIVSSWFDPSSALGIFFTGTPATVAFFFLIYGLVVFIIGGAVSLGLKLFNVRLITNQPQRPFSTLFERFDILLKALLLQLAMGFFIFLWTLLLIIPGIIAAYRYSMAPYLMAQNPNLGVMEAINMSKKMMMGHKGRLFILELSFIGWAILCVFTLGIGYLWLFPYMNASEAAFYTDLSARHEGATPQQPQQPYGSTPVQ